MRTTRINAHEKAILIDLLRHECDYELPDEVMDEFLTPGRVMKVPKWHTVIASGDKNPDIYIAMEGIMRCWYWDGDREKTALFSTIPTMFLSYHTYYGGEPSFYNFQTCTPAKIVHITRRHFDDMIATNLEFARWNLRLAYEQLYYYEVKSRLNTGMAMERYQTLLKEIPNIVNEVPLQTVASYLDITPQHLSRLRRSLAKERL